MKITRITLRTIQTPREYGIERRQGLSLTQSRLIFTM